VSWAEWEEKVSDGISKIYFNKSTIRKNGQIIKMWVLEDFVTVQRISDGRKYKSSKVYHAIDCKSEMRAIASIVFYESEFGGGKVIVSLYNQEKNWNWKPIVPDSISEMMLKVACGKK
jgi:hypothetical protein